MRNLVRIGKRKNFKMEKGSIYEQGYGMVPKLVMRDKRLTAEAKSIYAYLCSFAGAGNEAFPSVALMMGELRMSKDRFYKHMKLLLDNGYIVKHQMVDDDNKFHSNVYELVQAIEKDSLQNLELFRKDGI